MPNIIFIHGLESSGQGFKGRLFKKVIPGCLTPDFKGRLEERMKRLIEILKQEFIWIIIGSSYGGFIGVLYALKFPRKVEKLILLAPFLAGPELDLINISPIHLPVIVYHGKNDKIVSLEKSRDIAKQLFTNLTYNIVNEDHLLHNTVKNLDWTKLVEVG